VGEKPPLPPALGQQLVAGSLLVTGRAFAPAALRYACLYYELPAFRALWLLRTAVCGCSLPHARQRAGAGRASLSLAADNSIGLLAGKRAHPVPGVALHEFQPMVGVGCAGTGGAGAAATQRAIGRSVPGCRPAALAAGGLRVAPRVVFHAVGAAKR